MRIDVQKCLVVGHWSRQDRFFERAQQLAVAEFISHKPSSHEIPSDVQTYTDALHVLRTIVPVEEVRPSQDHYSAIVIAQDIVERKGELEQLAEKARVLQKEIARIEPFGDFSLPTLDALEKETKRKIQFFFSKKKGELEAAKRDEVIYVGSAYELTYYVAINEKPQNYEGLIEMVFDHSLGELQQDRANVQRRIDECETDLSRFSHHKGFLKEGLLKALDQYHLEESTLRSEGYVDGDIFAVEAWVPKDKIHLFEQMSGELQIFVSTIKIEKNERVPTYLENKGVARLGEDLVKIYDVPSNHDRDPSLWVFGAFGLFFSMIVGDAGYGLLLLGISLLLLFKYGKAGGLVRRIILLSTSLSIGCIIWGVMTSSYLGVQVPPDSKLRDFTLMKWMVNMKADYLIKSKGPAYDEWIEQFPNLATAKTPEAFIMGGVQIKEGKTSYTIFDKFSDNVMMELVIFIGTIHIMLSFLRYLDRHWAGVGWVIFMAGCYLFFPSILKAVSLGHYILGIDPVGGAKIGIYMLFSGLGLAMVLSVIQNKMAGLGEVMHVIGVFADVMSYLRIYALSLAGMIMATTFDQIGTSVPLYVGIFILLAGHTINFVLALGGGVIHGLRLNFIEWYHYSFEGGGKDFNPLSLRSMKID